MTNKIKGINAFDFSELNTFKEIVPNLKVRIVGIKYYCDGVDGDKTQSAFSRSVKGVDWDELDEGWAKQYERDYGHLFKDSIAFTRNGKNQFLPISGLN